MIPSLLLLASLAPAALANPFGFPGLPQLHSRATCSGNTATTRTEWCDYDVSTDYYTTCPDTGVTREYWLELTDVTVSPDGVERSAMAINGSIPGPTLFADWGDTVIVHVTNSLTTSTNGTSLHFHGIRQNYTNQNDGVASITQCPTAVGETATYTWKATQYGSTWYHSHFALQAWEGVFGGIIINGPATSDYDEDLGVLFLNDWDHQTVDELYYSAETNGPPTLDNGLINGTNVYGDDDDSSQTGSRFTTQFTSGTSYRIRLVNAAVDTHFKFSIDNHTLTVIATDLVPIVPYTTEILNIGMGQRYDIIVTADQSATASNFWMRAIPQIACSDNDSTDNIKGIVYYGDSAGTPTTTGYDYTDSCDDEDVSDLVPYLSKTVDSASFSELETATVGTNSDNLFKWYLNSTTMVVDWADPTLLQIYDGATSFETSNAVIQLSDANEWVYLVIQTTLAVPHPIHLHGFDFYILAQGTGFALQFVVRQDEITDLIDYDSLNSTCTAWSSYASAEDVEQDDSGV
ncbi:Laccase-2-like protein 4 [Pleurostoma richardsiae]|uniref:Laccase-2-like protein 4 n=1 Tax=Pleurostoma richardsiae TaxID=41990 RepID=A0AA38RVX6_9PEZI|nr:Laccase-2-like protein 4 [Pleurostoma richardsiae]